jgi:hypothetical protein
MIPSGVEGIGNLTDNARKADGFGASRYVEAG